ncbi:MAG TPA: sigma-70 family RNA polymerase sigma factor [Phycisphaerae bacterium]|nr:sigma-70 family RNA polymerase sigma factor [Phycisphaerales bacterium]HRX83943.1 sigma-70 family RNA polymerase sigma factor [Phycisphaerae bacterium]
MAERPQADAAFTALLDRYEQPLIGYAARITGDAHRARDVVQETLLKFVSDGAPRDPDRAAAWLFKVCRNAALSVRRKEKRVQPLTLDIADRQLAGDASPLADVERGDETARVLALVADLPERQQEVVRLRFHAGLSYRQIAEVLDITTNNVGVMLHHALTRLRRQLCEPEEIPNASPGSLS